MKAVQSFHVDSRAYVRVGNDMSECFLVNVRLRQGCVILNGCLGGETNPVEIQFFSFLFNCD